MSGSGTGVSNDEAEGDKMSARMLCAACAAWREMWGPGKESRRRPASHGDVLLSGLVAVSLEKNVRTLVASPFE